MKTNPIAALAELGQSVWYDNIHRAMLKSGELAEMVKQDRLGGVTSNPSIFEKAITSGNDYDAALAELLRSQPKASSRDLFFALAIDDIRDAADVLRPVYDASNGRDGFVSLEVSPDLAHDTAASVEEAKQLFARLRRPNVMIKIPATEEGIPAIEQLIAAGINVNVTLLFSIERYVAAAQAYLRGLQTRHQRGEAVDSVASVASFFISRVDSLVDKRLADRLERAETTQKQGIKALMGRCAVANAKLAYSKYQELYNNEAFAKLRAAGARTQRLLWASTGVKSPDYSDVFYIDSLIGEETVNTIPPATYDAFKDHGQVRPTLTENMAGAGDALKAVAALGVDLAQGAVQLEQEGVAAFVKSFENLLHAIEEKTQKIGRPDSSAA